MVHIATDEDRKLAQYLRDVRQAVLNKGGNEEQFLSCLASVLAEFRNGMYADKLGAEIAEHG